MNAQVIEGIIENVVPQDSPVETVPGALQPTVIPTVEVARRLRSELKERYRGVRFSLRSHTVRQHWGSNFIKVEYEGGPPAEEVAAVAEPYLGAWYQDYAPGDGGCYHDLPGRWVGSEFIRYEVDDIWVHRVGSGTVVVKLDEP